MFNRLQSVTANGFREGPNPSCRPFPRGKRKRFDVNSA
jgi:hypothetical protein